MAAMDSARRDWIQNIVDDPSHRLTLPSSAYIVSDQVLHMHMHPLSIIIYGMIGGRGMVQFCSTVARAKGSLHWKPSVGIGSTRYCQSYTSSNSFA
jgi:hypothetical protein